MVRGRDAHAELVQTMSRLLRDQGYSATGRAQLLRESGVSNGSLYHHFPGGMEEVAQAALEASGRAVADALRQALDGAPHAGEGIARFLDLAQGVGTDEWILGCPVAPTALESPTISPRLRAVAAQCFEQWQALIEVKLRTDGWREDSCSSAASAALALVEGALLLARVSGRQSHLTDAKQAALTLFAPGVNRMQGESG